jgi:hypothetical protein
MTAAVVAMRSGSPGGTLLRVVAGAVVLRGIGSRRRLVGDARTDFSPGLVAGGEFPRKALLVVLAG